MHFFFKWKFSKELIKFNDPRKPGISKSLEGSKMKVQHFSRIFQTLSFTETHIHLARFWIGSFNVEFGISHERYDDFLKFSLVSPPNSSGWLGQPKPVD